MRNKRRDKTREIIVRNSGKGLSLIEVSIAIVVLALVFGGMLAMFKRGFRIGRKSKDLINANAIAREIMEEYSDWNRLVWRTGSDPPAIGSYTDPPFSVTRNNTTYTAILDISNGPIPATPSLKQIEVTVTWGGESFVLRTLKGNY